MLQQSGLTLDQIKQAGNTIISNNGDGQLITKYGKYTFNYWYELRPGLWVNYDCKTKHY